MKGSLKARLRVGSAALDVRAINRGLIAVDPAKRQQDILTALAFGDLEADEVEPLANGWTRYSKRIGDIRYSCRAKRTLDNKREIADQSAVRCE